MGKRRSVRSPLLAGVLSLALLLAACGTQHHGSAPSSGSPGSTAPARTTASPGSPTVSTVATSQTGNGGAHHRTSRSGGASITGGTSGPRPAPRGSLAHHFQQAALAFRQFVYEPLRLLVHGHAPAPRAILLRARAACGFSGEALGLAAGQARQSPRTVDLAPELASLAGRIGALRNQLVPGRPMIAQATALENRLLGLAARFRADGLHVPEVPAGLP
jgi:hypothetical protein